MIVFLGAVRVFAMPFEDIAAYGVQNWQREHGLPQNSILAIAQSDDGYLWLGTREGLVRFNGSHFLVFDPYNTAALVDSQINDIVAFSNRELWIATPKGLIHYREGRFNRLTVLNGLPHDEVLALARGAEGELWVGTRDGLALMSGGTFRVWRQRDGLLGSRVQALARHASDGVWIGSNGGLQRLGTSGFETVLDVVKAGSIAGVVTLHADEKGHVWAGAGYMGLHHWAPGGEYQKLDALNPYRAQYARLGHWACLYGP